jgi:hypothetical protein
MDCAFKFWDAGSTYKILEIACIEGERRRGLAQDHIRRWILVLTAMDFWILSPESSFLSL